ncbi:PREDICTED: uncharacterized protein LOC108686639 [Atta colombica]|uniref:uncharacterized protein LOC108686639 n=1 Tax=Atta colombica TaxID=520822 RepID=UPI00084CC699|nr:PREDICTED: uncharacterized protein LOC108686639 [Atta colombica]
MIKKLLERWFIRSKIKNKQEALNIRRKLAIIYAIVGWNMFGVLFYKIIKHKMPEDPTERRLSYRLLSETPSNMHVYQVTGLTLTNDFDIVCKDEITQEKENKKNKKAIANEI